MVFSQSITLIGIVLKITCKIGKILTRSIYISFLVLKENFNKKRLLFGTTLIEIFHLPDI